MGGKRIACQLKLGSVIIISSQVVDAFVPYGNVQRIPTPFTIHDVDTKRTPTSFCPQRNINHNVIGKRFQSNSVFELNGISEWRDTFFNVPDDEDEYSGMSEDGIAREVTVLPFPYEDVLLQGETKQLRLYEDRFIRLFEECMEEHSGVVAMGLIADSGIIQTVPLCEVEAYNRMEEFGIFVTLRVVGRGALLELTKQEPYIKAVCVEVMDTISPNLDIPNLLASNIENSMISVSSLEHKLSMRNQGTGLRGISDVKDEDMRRRMVEAKLDDAFYDEVAIYEEEEEYDDDEENDMDLDDITLDRNAQFRAAYVQAKDCDTQGYMISGDNQGERNAQELTALSWAIFCTEDVQDTVRVQALDCDDLLDRLKMGSFMLREKKAELEAKLALTDVKLIDDDDDESDD